MEKIFFTIREVAQRLSVAPSLIRFWEKYFNNILQPHKNSKGARRYQEKDIVQLQYIYTLVKDKGYSLAGARKVIQKRGDGAPIMPAEVVHKLRSLRGFLINLKAHMHEV